MLSLVLQSFLVDHASQLAVVHLREGRDVRVLVENRAVLVKIVLHHRRVVQQLVAVVLEHNVVRELAQARIDVLLLDSRNQIGPLYSDLDILQTVDCPVGVDAFNMDIERRGSHLRKRFLRLLVSWSSVHFIIHRRFSFHCERIF